MANIQQTLGKVRKKIRGILGDSVQLEDYFFTFDRDTQSIVTNRKIDGYHFIFNLDGDLIKQHEEDD